MVSSTVLPGTTSQYRLPALLRPSTRDQLDVGMRRQQCRALHADVAGGTDDGGAKRRSLGHGLTQYTDRLHTYAVGRRIAGARLCSPLTPRLRLPSALHVHRGADQREMRERLREVAEQLPAAHVHLLREQAERRAEMEQPLEATLGLLEVTGVGKRVDEPERREEERALVAAAVRPRSRPCGSG